MEQTDSHQRLSELVRARRLEMGMTPLQLSHESGVDGARISRIEAGLKIPAPETLAALAPVLQLPLEELYAAAGYPVPALPPLRPYLRRAYNVPERAAEEIERYLHELSARYGSAGQPRPGEDEQPE